MKNRFVILVVHIFALSLVFNPYLNALQKGSETIVSIEPWVEFPALDSDNKMLAFGCFKNGFALEDATTSCTFDSIFPVAGAIGLNGGTLYLGADLFLNNTCAFSTVGTVVGNKHMVHFASTISHLCGQPSNATYIDSDLFLNSDVAVGSGIRFAGDACMLNGNNHTLALEAGSEVVLDNGVTVTFKDIHITGMQGSRIRCNDGNCTIVFDNVHLAQDGNFSFTQGAFKVSRTVRLCGPHTFSFEAAQPCIINADSTLVLESGLTFSYDPVSTTSNLIQFVNQSSVLELTDDTSLFAQADGLVLKKGTMNVSGHAFILGEVRLSEQLTDTAQLISRGKVKNKGVTIGTGKSEDDFNIRIFDKSLLHVKTGSLVYRNTRATLCPTNNCSPHLYINTGARLYLRKSLDLQDGLAVFADGAILRRLTAANLTGNIMARGEILPYLAV